MDVLWSFERQRKEREAVQEDEGDSGLGKLVLARRDLQGNGNSLKL